MSQRRKSVHFEKKETGYHKYAVEELATWVQGVVEQPFYIEDKIAFVPDIVCYKDGILDSFYEVVHSHPLNGHKLGLIMDWCYRNATEVSVYEVSADYVLAQIKKPDRIMTMECYVINPFEY